MQSGWIFDRVSRMSAPYLRLIGSSYPKNGNRTGNRIVGDFLDDLVLTGVLSHLRIALVILPTALGTEDLVREDNDSHKTSELPTSV
jgi:hypothetical protein